jgi:Flp pilus assembly protein TadD
MQTSIIWGAVASGRLRRLGSTVLLGMLAGCSTTPVSDRFSNAPLTYDARLVTGELIFGEPVSPNEVPDVDVLGLDDAMLTFVEQRVAGHRLSVVRLRALLHELDAGGFFTNSYDALHTRSAIETFHTQLGNCLSYTHMFIALARAAGLEAHYQIVNVPPSWNAASGMLIRNNHINVLLRGARFSMAFSHQFTVDFNTIDPGVQFQRWVVSDDYARSLHYANLSVEAMRKSEYRPGFAYLQKAMAIAPGNPDIWINLGAFYGRFDRFDEALRAFELALELDPDNRTAMSGMSRSYAALGESKLAARYERKVRFHRERNPYYHFALAQSAFEDEHYEESLAAVNQAIELESRVARFHFMKALAERQLGDDDAARRSLIRARRYDDSFEDLRRRYAPDLAALEG